MSVEIVPEAKAQENGQPPPEYASLGEALLAFQTEAPKLQKTAINPAFKARYVPLESLMAVVTPALAKHGLIWVTFPGLNEHGAPALMYQLKHVTSGEQVSGEMLLMVRGDGPQAQGSAITYARRYSLMAVLGLVADEDDDGKRAKGPATPKVLTEGQRERVVKGVEAKGGNLDLLLAAVGAESVEVLTTEHAQQIKKLLEA